MWNALPTTCLRDLSYDPFCGGMHRDTHPQNAPSCLRTSNPYSSRNEIVGTTKRSIEAIEQVEARHRYWPDLRCEVHGTAKAPSIARLENVPPKSCRRGIASIVRSSPWMRGAPQSGLARLTWRISRRISGVMIHTTSNPYSSRNEIVGTTKRSIEARNLPRDLCGGKPSLGHLSDRLAANKDSFQSLLIRPSAAFQRCPEELHDDPFRSTLHPARLPARSTR